MSTTGFVIGSHPWSLQTHWGPDSKAHGANMGPIWGRQDPGGPDVGPMNFTIWGGGASEGGGGGGLASSEAEYSLGWI